MNIFELKPYENKVFSQNGEDGIIKKIFEIIGFSNRYYVEIGVEDGRECNTRYLREVCACQGIQFDRDYENLEINLHQALITAENINTIFTQYKIPHEFDLLSLDIDGNDFYLWFNLQENYRPRVVIVEYNSSHSPQEDKVVQYSTQRAWDGTNYFGASILAWKNLGVSKDYSLVYAESHGINSFFIRNDILKEKQIQFQHINNVELLYMPPKYYGFWPYSKNRQGHPPDSLKRDYLTSQEILKKGQFTDIIAEDYNLLASVGESISFAGQTADFLHPKLFKQGFYYPEENLTWLDGKYAFLKVKFKENIPSLIELEIVSVFLSKNNPYLEVEVFLNQRLVDIWKFAYKILENNISKFIKCSPQLFTDKADNSNLLTIEFKMKGATSPKKLGLGEDERNLSFALSQIKFH